MMSLQVSLISMFSGFFFYPDIIILKLLNEVKCSFYNVNINDTNLWSVHDMIYEVNNNITTKNRTENKNRSKIFRFKSDKL